MSHGVSPFFLCNYGWIVSLSGIREQGVDMIDQAASQPSLATVALNLARNSSRDKFVAMVVRVCKALPPDALLNTRRADGRNISSHA